MVDVQSKMLERQKHIQVKPKYLMIKEEKSKEMYEAMTLYNKSSGYSISI